MLTPHHEDRTHAGDDVVNREWSTTLRQADLGGRRRLRAGASRCGEGESGDRPDRDPNRITPRKSGHLMHSVGDEIGLRIALAHSFTVARRGELDQISASGIMARSHTTGVASRVRAIMDGRADGD
jgi:hypothetical protein